MDIAESWAWSLAAIAVVAGLLRVAVLAERRLARTWPDLHARWSRNWRMQHALAAAMALIGIALARHAHGWPDGVEPFGLCIVWAVAAAALAYMALWIYLAILVCLYPPLLPDVLGGLRHAWRHRRDAVPPGSDWLPPGSAKLADPAAPEREP